MTKEEEKVVEGVTASGMGASHLVAMCVGGFLWLVYAGLSQTHQGYRVTYFAPFHRSAAGEVYLWLAQALLACPASLLLGYALSPWLARPLGRLWRRLSALLPKRTLWTLVCGALLVCVLFVTGRQVFLMDYPVTDEEYSTRFGGQLLASGKIKMNLPFSYQAFPKHFLYKEGDNIASFDWLGIHVGWAIAEMTRLRSVFFSLVAALTSLLIGLLLSRLLGPAWGVLGLCMFALSPMGFALSLTTHAHLLSRCLLVLGLVVYINAREKENISSWGWVGFFFGIAALCRPFEIVFLVAPLFLERFFFALRGEQQARRASVGLLLGLVIPLAIFMTYNTFMTGNPLLHPRFSQQVFAEKIDTEVLNAARYWFRFGSNTSYNLLMLCVWFFGPIGIALVAIGTYTNKLTRLLMLGLFCHLLLGLFHENSGVHFIGPIHYSEAIVFLMVVAMYGLKTVFTFFQRVQRESRFSPSVLGSVLLVGVVLSLGTFNIQNAFSLRQYVQPQHHVYTAIQEKIKGKAVLLAPMFVKIWAANPVYRGMGGWVYEWRRPRPDLQDDVLILRDFRGAYAHLKPKFPTRTFYRIRPLRFPPFMKIFPIKKSK